MRVWTLEEATAELPRVRRVVRRIRELVAMARERAAHPGASDGAKPSSNGHGRSARSESEQELRALVDELTADGIVVRDPARGLIDFPAVSVSGRPYLLCWLDGEEAIEWWHWPEAGFAGRTPISEPPA
ncbi:MAG TPA: DUF2203 domain-containing protein [Acidimicrobiia bacterium]|nr:DUF2203 domain-containing protein [Acidimicrobiia bacterium]